MWYSDSRRRKVSRDVTRTPRILEDASEGRAGEGEGGGGETREGRGGEVGKRQVGKEGEVR